MHLGQLSFIARLAAPAAEGFLRPEAVLFCLYMFKEASRARHTPERNLILLKCSG